MSNYKKYGLTLAEYEAMKVLSNNTCYVCGAKPKKRSLNIDHHHKIATQLKKQKKGIGASVRGLLCSQCNRYLIGKMGDRTNAIELFEKAVIYLKKYRDKPF